jgi:pilus assembly protein Flp/PilA
MHLPSPEEHSVKIDVLRILRSLHDDKSGQDLVEYALVAALIALGAITTMSSLATSVNTAFSVAASTLSSAVA